VLCYHVLSVPPARRSSTIRPPHSFFPTSLLPWRWCHRIGLSKGPILHLLLHLPAPGNHQDHRVWVTCSRLVLNIRPPDSTHQVLGALAPNPARKLSNYAWGGIVERCGLGQLK
jgi:hypothetical protein